MWDVVVAAARGSWPLDWLTPRAAAGEGSTLTQTAADIGAAAGTETIRVIGDLMIAEDVERIVAETEAAFGSIDILVHNAGGNIRAGGAGGHPDPDDAIDIAIAGAPSALAPLRRRGPGVPISPAALSFLAILSVASACRALTPLHHSFQTWRRCSART